MYRFEFQKKNTKDFGILFLFSILSFQIVWNWEFCCCCGVMIFLFMFPLVRCCIHFLCRISNKSIFFDSFYMYTKWNWHFLSLFVCLLIYLFVFQSIIFFYSFFFVFSFYGSSSLRFIFVAQSADLYVLNNLMLETIFARKKLLEEIRR